MRRRCLTALMFVALTAPVIAQDKPPQDKPIRNAPSPGAMQFAAYIYAASNVCGYGIGTDAFAALLAKQNVTPEDVSPRGPFANRLTGMFTLMSNQMVMNREQACLAVAGEYGPEGNIARNVLLPNPPEQAPPQDQAAPAKPAQ